MTLRAVIAGVTGLIGSNLAEHLVSKGWEVYGIARKPQTGIPGVRPVAADLLDPEALRASLAGIDPTHVFLTTWVRRASEEENIAANGALVRNLLSALKPSGSLRHVALVTDLNHYLGPFEDYAKSKVETPLREEMPRLTMGCHRGRVMIYKTLGEVAVPLAAGGVAFPKKGAPA
jgi:nucleoside-diphosphate-sugar epimerase